MPGESSEMMEQSVSTEVSPQLPDEPPLSVSNEPVSISPNELTNGVKRPLPIDLTESDEIKKMKLTENVHEKESGVSSLNNEIDKEETHIDISKNIDHMTEHNSGKNSCVSNKTNNENDITNNHIDDKAQNIDTIDENKSTDVCIDNENKSSNTNNVNNNCGPTISEITVNGTESASTSRNGFVQDDQISNDDSSQLKMSSTNVDDVDKISLSTKTLAVNKNCSITNRSETSDIDVQLPSVSNTHQSVTENTNEPIVMETVNDHNNYTANIDDNDCVFIEPNGNSDLDDNGIDNVLKERKQLCRDTLQDYLKLFSREEFDLEKFESYFLQVIASQSTSIHESGKLRYKVQVLTAREKRWKSKYLYVVKQLKELGAITKLHANELISNVDAKPHIITRTVGLQATLQDPKKDGEVQLPRTITSSRQFNNEPVDISDGDDEDRDDRDDGNDRNDRDDRDSDIIPLDSLKNTEPVNSNCIENKTQKKQLPSSLNPSPAKDVPSAMPLTNGYSSLTTIDLTGPDDLNIPQKKINLEKSPIKIIQRGSHIGSSSQLPKGVTYIELPHNLPQSSSAFIVRASSSGSTPLTTTVANLSTSNVTKTPVRPFVYKDGKLLPVQLSPVTVQRKIQPSPNTFNRQSLQPVPPSIPIVLKHPAPLPGVPNQKSLITWKKIPPAPVITLSESLDAQNPKALVLSWNMSINNTIAEICSYQIYSYQEISSEAPRTDLWRKIGDVNALPLPMSCSLTKYMSGGKYYFAVRAVDKYNRAGPFSPPHFISS